MSQWERQQYNNSGGFQYCIYNDKSPRQKINKETLDLNYMFDQTDPTDMHKTGIQQQHNTYSS